MPVPEYGQENVHIVPAVAPNDNESGMMTTKVGAFAGSFLACTVCMLAAGEARAKEDAGSSGFGASLRSVAAATRNYDNPALFGAGNDSDGYSENILRLTAGGRPNDRIAFECHWVLSQDFFTAGRAAGVAGLGLSGTSDRYRVADMEASWGDGDSSGYSLVDRVNIKLSFPQADLTIGRQAITFGQTYFWNPLDVFSPFDPRSFDRDYKPGVDAYRLDLPMGSFGGGNIIYASNWTGNALLVRLFGEILGWDLAVQGGKVCGGNEVGTGASGEAGPLEVRGEASWFFSKMDDPIPSSPSVKLLDDSFTGVAGLGRKITPEVGVEAEYLYNGSGLPGNLDAAAERVAAGDALHMGRHLAGVSVSWQAMPLLQTQLACLWSFSDRSLALQPGLTYSISDESELVVGALLNSGRRPSTDASGMSHLRSEFGTNPNVFYAEYKVYF